MKNHSKYKNYMNRRHSQADIKWHNTTLGILTNMSLHSAVDGASENCFNTSQDEISFRTCRHQGPDTAFFYQELIIRIVISERNSPEIFPILKR